MTWWRPRSCACVVAIVVGAIATTGCATDEPAVLFADPVATTTPVATTPPTVAPPTSAAPTTAPSTTEVTTTTLAVMPVALPVPVPPPDPAAAEPYTEVGTIEIPRLGTSRPLLEGITLKTLNRGPGHWPGTAMPGDVGNVVVAGHRVSHGGVFRHIDQLEPGDEVFFTTLAGRFRYVVNGTTIVKPDAMYILDQTGDRTATLFACHPPGTTRERIVVHLTYADE
jgi:sortase A